MRSIKRMLILLLVLAMLPAIPALAEDVCIVKDALHAADVTTDRAYLRLQCDLPGEAEVIVTVRDAWGSLVYQRNYGVKSGAFRSGDIHLPLEYDGCCYTVSLSAGDVVHAFTVMREMAMITDSAVYAGGLTLQDLADGSPYKYAMVLDLHAMVEMEQPVVVPMLASGMQVGEVTFTMLDGVLTVSAVMTADGTIDKATVYVATDAITARTLGSKNFAGLKTKLDKEIKLGDTPYAAVMVQLTLTYDPTTAQAWELTKQEKEALELLKETWDLMQMMTVNEAVG